MFAILEITLQIRSSMTTASQAIAEAIERENLEEPSILEQKDDHTLEGKVKSLPQEQNALEAEVNEVENDESEIGPFNRYSFSEEQFLAEQFYKSSPLDYEQLFYGARSESPPAFGLKDEYWVTTTASDADSEFLTVDQAQHTFLNVQYAAVIGAGMSINFDEKRKLDFWIKFNPALFKMFEALYAVTQEVNYASPG